MLARNLGTTILNSFTIVPVSHFKCCETLFALLKCDDNKLIVETSFSHVIPAFRDSLLCRENPFLGTETEESLGAVPGIHFVLPMQVHQQQDPSCQTSD